MAMKQANAAQKQWMKDITKFAETNMYVLYGDDYNNDYIPIQRHHVLGRSAKHNKVAIGHWFILPVPYELHDPSEDHEFHVGKCKHSFVERYGTQRELFNDMFTVMRAQGYVVPGDEVYNAIMDTNA
tara:strand:- start:591 stop:971 length:381 start_codon:yes stop_codon:yes gene_type:complete